MNLRNAALLLVGGSSAANSVNGLLLRSVEDANEWQLVFYRSIALGFTLFCVFLIRHRTGAWREFTRLGWLGLAGAIALSVTNMGFIWSIQHTTVANTMFLLGAVPFFTALLARAVLGERITPVLWIAIIIAMTGVCIMVWDGLGQGTLLGNGFAVLTALGIASYVVILRRGRHMDMVPVIVIGAAISVVVSASFTKFDLAISLHDASLMLFWGGVLSAMVHLLITFGARHVQGAELSLMTLFEFTLAPLWVLLVFAERPSNLTIVGGAMVIIAVVGQALYSMRQPAASDSS